MHLVALIEHDIRLGPMFYCLSRIPPRLDKLCSTKQAQPPLLNGTLYNEQTAGRPKYFR